MGSGCYSLYPAVWIPPISKSGSGPRGAVPANKAGTSPLLVPILGPYLRRYHRVKINSVQIFIRIMQRINLIHYLLYVGLCAEARGLVRALLQPDPTVRLTAGQALLHPWVKAMAPMCRQRALTDKAQRDITDNGAEPDKEQRGAQNNAGETIPEETPGHSSSEGELTQKERCRPSEVNAGQHRAEHTPTSNTDCDPGSLIGDSSTHTDPPAETDIQSQLNGH